MKRIRLFLMMVLLALPFGVRAEDISTYPNQMSDSQVKRTQGAVDEITFMRNQIAQDLSENRYYVRHGDHFDGDYFDDSSLFLDDKGAVRLYRVLWGKENQSLIVQYFYDEKGRLGLVQTHSGGIWNGNWQNIFLDIKGHILRVEYSGILKDENGKNQRVQGLALSKPELLEDGTEVQMIQRPKEDYDSGRFAGPPLKYKDYGVLGASFIQPSVANLVAGFYGRDLGLRAEGGYWGPNDWGSQVNLSRSISETPTSRTNFSLVFGARNGTAAGSPTWYYAGIGFDGRGTLLYEIDFVNGEGPNSPQVTLAVLFQVGIPLKLN